MWWGCILSKQIFFKEGTSELGFKGCTGVNSKYGAVNGQLHSRKMNAKMLVLEERRGKDLTY